MNSDSIRNQILKIRKQVSSVQRAEMSIQITSRFLSVLQEGHHFEMQGCKMGMYRALSDEVDLQPLFFELQKQGSRFFFPRVLPEKQMEFIEVNSSTRWTKSSYGIDEPHSDLKGIDAQELDLIFVPGVAFGELGERIGRGQGYYDRFLPRAPQALRVALAFDFQVLHSLPQASHDQPVHWVVTELREFRNQRAGLS